jgi:hypothetical protein
MTPSQHPGSEVHENAGGAAPPAVEKEECKLGNVETALDRTVAGSRLANYLAKLGEAEAGLTVLGVIRGETRMDSGPDQVGHEQFGFKDGVSQPGVGGVDAPTDPLHNPDLGDPGQDLLHPGEFVFGYPTQIPEAPDFDHDGPNPCQGPDSGEGIDWLKNGSLLVFRRLVQDVAGFRHAVAKNAAQLGITTDLLSAKLVGRYAGRLPVAHFIRGRTHPNDRF